MPDEALNIAAVQMDIAWEDPPSNYQRVSRLLQTQPPGPGSLIILPEMFPTGFSMNLDHTAENASLAPSLSAEFLRQLASDYQCAVLGGITTRNSQGKGQNEAVAFAPDGRLLCRYRKIQPFSLSGEAEAFSPGTDTCAFEWQGVRIAPLICYDLRFPEWFRRGAADGAELYPVIASWPMARIQHWVTLLQARAIENLAYTVGVNRIGTDPSFRYTGRTLIANPHGDIVMDAGDRETVLHHRLEISSLREWRKKFPALRDRKDRLDQPT